MIVINIFHFSISSYFIDQRKAKRKADVLHLELKVPCNEMCLSVCLSVGLSVCRRVFYLGVQVFCSETLSWSAFSEPPPEGGLDFVTNRQGAI